MKKTLCLVLSISLILCGLTIPVGAAENSTVCEQLLTFEQATDINKLTAIGFNTNGKDSYSIVTDPEDPANHVLKVIMNGNTANSDRTSAFTIKTNDSVNDSKQLSVSFNLKLGSTKKGHGFAELGTPINSAGDCVSYSIKQAGHSFDNSSAFMRFTSPKYYYDKVIASIGINKFPVEGTMKNYQVVTDFSKKTYGNNRDFKLIINGSLVGLNNLSQADKDLLTGQISQNTYDGIKFAFIARRGSSETDAAEDGQIYYLDDIKVQRLGDMTVSTSTNVSSLKLQENVVYTTDADVDALSLENIVVKDKNGNIIACPITLGNNGKTIIVQTASKLASEQSYTITGDISALSGQTGTINTQITTEKQLDLKIDFENPDDINKLITSTFNVNGMDTMKIVQDPDDSSNHVLEIVMNGNTTTSERASYFKFNTGDSVSDTKNIIVSCKLRLGNTKIGQGIVDLASPLNNAGNNISYLIRQAGYNWEDVSHNMFRFSSSDSIYSKLFGSINHSNLPEMKWKTYTTVTDFSNKVYGKNRDVNLIIDGNPITKNTLSQSEADSLVGGVTDYSYSAIMFGFNARATNNVQGAAEDGQIYYLDDIEFIRNEKLSCELISNELHAVSDPIVIKFSNPVNTLTSDNIILKKCGSNHPYTYSVTTSADNTELIIKPLTDLLYNTDYEINIDGFKDIYGQSCPAGTILKFKTEPPKGVNASEGVTLTSKNGATMEASSLFNVSATVKNPEPTEMPVWVVVGAYNSNNRLLRISGKTIESIAANSSETVNIKLSEVPLGTKMLRVFIMKSPKELKAYQSAITIE